MWRSVMLHEFPNEDIQSFQALPGHLAGERLPIIRNGAAQIRPGLGFRYVLRDPLSDLIGVSCRVRLSFTYQGFTGQPAPILQLGESVELRILGLPVPNFESWIYVRVAGADLQFGGVLPSNPSQVFDFRFDWHTSGQAFLRANGQLLGYHNALSPTVRLAVFDVALGYTAPITDGPTYAIERLFIRVLSRQDPLAILSRELPAVDLPPDQFLERCRTILTIDLMSKLDRVRSFMTQFNQATSQPWSSGSESSEGPFDPEAILAHDLGNRAVAELWTMLRSRDFTRQDRFLDPFTESLKIMHRVLPEEFQQLAMELGQTPAIAEECREVIENALGQRRHQFAPLIALLDKANERIAQIAQVD
jgi:hypothetical protein